MSETVAGRIKAARERSGLSAGELSIKAGLSRGYVALIERGERPCPSGETLLKLATTLGVSIDWLMTGAEKSSPTLPGDAGNDAA